MSLSKEQEFKLKIPKTDLKMSKLRKKIQKQKQLQLQQKMTNKRNKSSNSNLSRMITCKAITLKVKSICKMTKLTNNLMIMKMTSDFYQSSKNIQIKRIYLYFIE